MARKDMTDKLPKDFDDLVSKMEPVEDEVPPPPGMEAPQGGERPKVMVPRWVKELREDMQG